VTSADRVLIEIRRRAIDREVQSRMTGATPAPGQMPRVTVHLRSGWQLIDREVVDHKPGAGFVELSGEASVGGSCFVLTDEISMVIPLWR
jgi:hypothetical protein